MSFPISYCCHASPEAVSVSSPLQTYIKTLVLGAMAFIYRRYCFITIKLATITWEGTVFAHSSLAQKLFLSGLFLFPRACSGLVLGFSHHCSFGVSYSSSLTYTQACRKTNSPLPLHNLQVLLLWNMLAIKVFNVSVTIHHKWVYLWHTIIVHDNSDQMGQKK